MNPLRNNNFNNFISQNYSQNIQQVKNLMNMFKGNPQAILQQNPKLNQLMQLYQGQDLKSVFYNQAKSMGIDPDKFLNDLLN